MKNKLFVIVSCIFMFGYDEAQACGTAPTQTSPCYKYRPHSSLERSLTPPLKDTKEVFDYASLHKADSNEVCNALEKSQFTQAANFIRELHNKGLFSPSIRQEIKETLLPLYDKEKATYKDKRKQYNRNNWCEKAKYKKDKEDFKQYEKSVVHVIQVILLIKYQPMQELIQKTQDHHLSDQERKKTQKLINHTIKELYC